MALEHQIMTQGESLNEIRNNIRLLLRAYKEVVGLETLFGMPPAPEKYWKMFEEAQSSRLNLETAAAEL